MDEESNKAWAERYEYFKAQQERLRESEFNLDEATNWTEKELEVLKSYREDWKKKEVKER